MEQSFQNKHKNTLTYISYIVIIRNSEIFTFISKLHNKTYFYYS